MRLIVKLALAGLFACTALGSPALALGPIDGEIGAVWWANDFDGGGVSNLSSDAGAPGYRAELWLLKKYGFRATRYSSDLDNLSTDTSDYTTVDLMWKAFSPTENNFFAVGLGWEEMDMGLIGLDTDTSGMRIAMEARVGLAGMVHAYGQAAYLPSLDDAAATNPQFGRFEDMDGYELEIGVSWKAAPFVSVRAGYRESSVDFSQTGIDPVLGYGSEMGGEAEASGFLLGLGLHF